MRVKWGNGAMARLRLEPAEKRSQRKQFKLVHPLWPEGTSDRGRQEQFFTLGERRVVKGSQASRKTGILLTLAFKEHTKMLVSRTGKCRMFTEQV
jgi:hypothetical protein